MRDETERERESKKNAREHTQQNKAKKCSTGGQGESRGDHAIKMGAELGGFPYPTVAEHMNI